MDYQKLKEKRNRENPFARFLGVIVEDISEGCARATMEIRDEMFNPVGSVHGGCLYTLADIVCGSAMSSYGQHAVTVSGEYHYLAPAMHTRRLTAVAQVIKRGKAICFFEVTIFDDQQKLLGKGTFLFHSLPQQIEL